MSDKFTPANVTRAKGKRWLEGRWLGLGEPMFIKDKGLLLLGLSLGRKPPPVTDEIDIDSLSCLDETSLYFDSQRAWLIVGWYGNHPWLYCFDASELGLCRETIRYVGESYFADAHHVFFFGSDGQFLKVPEAHPASLEALPLPERGTYHRETRNCFARDQAAAYCNGKVFSSSPDQLQLTNHEDYFLLDSRLYYQQLPLLFQDDLSPCRIPAGRDYYLLADQWGTDGSDLYLRLDKGNSRTGEWNTIKRFPTADPTSFVSLGSCYAKDSNYVYCSEDGRILTKADPRTFRVIDGRDGSTPLDGIATDGTYVFCVGKVVKEANAAAFHDIGLGYFGDDRQLWWLGENSPELLADADIASFQVIDLGPSYGAMDRTGPWEANRRRSIVDETCIEKWRPYFEAHPELQDFWWHRHQPRVADDQSDSREELGHPFARVGGRIHFQDQPLFNVDVASFRIINEQHFADCNGLYAIDGSRLLDDDWRLVDACHAAGKGKIVFIGGDRWDDKTIRHPTPQSFSGDGSGWLWDGSKVYFEGVAKKAIDAGRFASLGYGYARDGQQVYRQGKPLNFEIDVGTAEALNSNFLRDGNGRLFFDRKKIGKGVDVGRLSFYRGDGFAQDGRFVYFVSPYGLRAMPDADITSFSVIDFRYACDKKQQYDRRSLILENFGDDRCPPELYFE